MLSGILKYETKVKLVCFFTSNYYFSYNFIPYVNHKIIEFHYRS